MRPAIFPATDTAKKKDGQAQAPDPRQSQSTNRQNHRVPALGKVQLACHGGYSTAVLRFV